MLVCERPFKEKEDWGGFSKKSFGEWKKDIIYLNFQYLKKRIIIDNGQFDKISGILNCLQSVKSLKLFLPSEKLFYFCYIK